MLAVCICTNGMHMHMHVHMQDARPSGWKRDLYNAIIFSDIRRHFISFGKVRKEICINLPTTKIALDDGCARQKTRETNETTRQLLRFFCRSGFGRARCAVCAMATV